MRQSIPFGFHAKAINVVTTKDIATGFVVVNRQPAVLITACQPTGRAEMPYVVGEMVCRPENALEGLSLLASSMLAVLNDPDTEKDVPHTFQSVYEKGEYVAPCSLSDEATRAANLYLNRAGLAIQPNMTLAEMARCVSLLAQAPDSPQYFPRGKWATIQALEGDALYGEWKRLKEQEG